jgi:hypothetical protein
MRHCHGVRDGDNELECHIERYAVGDVARYSVLFCYLLLDDDGLV